MHFGIVRPSARPPRPLADRKAIQQTRDPEHLRQKFPPWMSEFASRLPEENEREKIVITETVRHRKERELKESPFFYERLGWLVYFYVTSSAWFEAFIMVRKKDKLLFSMPRVDADQPTNRLIIPLCFFA